MLANIHIFSLLFRCHSMAWSVRKCCHCLSKNKNIRSNIFDKQKVSASLCVFKHINSVRVFFIPISARFHSLNSNFILMMAVAVFPMNTRVWPKSIWQKNTSYHKRIIVWWVFIPLKLHTISFVKFQTDVFRRHLCPCDCHRWSARFKCFAFCFKLLCVCKCKLLFPRIISVSRCWTIVLRNYFSGTTGLTLKIFLVRRIFALHSVARLFFIWQSVSITRKTLRVYTMRRVVRITFSLFSSFFCCSFSFLSACKSIVCCDWTRSWSPWNVTKPISSFFAILFHLYLCLPLHTRTFAIPFSVTFTLRRRQKHDTVGQWQNKEHCILLTIQRKWHRR